MNKKILPIIIAICLTACQSINNTLDNTAFNNIQLPTNHSNIKKESNELSLNQALIIPLNPYYPTKPIQLCQNHFNNKNEFCVNPYWQIFGDNGLNEFMKMVVNHHKEFAIASLQLQKSLINHQKEQKNHHLQMGIGSNANVGGQYQKSNDDEIKSYQKSSQFSINANASWEIDLWQKLALQRQLSDWQMLANIDDYRAVYLSLTHNAIRSYINAKQLQYRLQMLKNKDKYYKEQEQFFKVRLKAGLIAENAKLNLEKNIQSYNSQKLTTQNELNNQLYELSRLSGISVEMIDNLLKHNANHQYLLDDKKYEHLTSDDIFNRPDIIAQFYKVKMALKQPELTKKSLYPNLVLTTNAGMASDNLLTLIKVPVLNWGLALNLPTLTPNEIKRTLKIDNLEKEQAILTYQDTLQKAYQDFYEKINAYQLAKQQLQIAKNNEKIAQSQFDGQSLQYKIGNIAYADFLDSYEELQAVKETVAEQEYARILAYLAVYQAVGGF